MKIVNITAKKMSMGRLRSGRFGRTADAVAGFRDDDFVVSSTSEEEVVGADIAPA
jgi:hypothetical protein